MAESKACKWVGILLPVLQQALGRAEVLPQRTTGRSLDELIAFFPELCELGVLTDGTERPIRRPKDTRRRDGYFSGKKKRHAVKHVTMVHPKTQYILGVSMEHSGRDHDKRVLDEEHMTCDTPLQLGGDSAFISTVIGAARIVTPYRRISQPPGWPPIPLTATQKEFNHRFSRLRVVVEHSNAGFKRNRSVTDVFRNIRAHMSDQLALVAMGLHNLRVTMRESYRHHAVT